MKSILENVEVLKNVVFAKEVTKELISRKVLSVMIIAFLKYFSTRGARGAL